MNNVGQRFKHASSGDTLSIKYSPNKFSAHSTNCEYEASEFKDDSPDGFSENEMSSQEFLAYFSLPSHSTLTSSLNFETPCIVV